MVTLTEQLKKKRKDSIQGLKNNNSRFPTNKKKKSTTGTLKLEAEKTIKKKLVKMKSYAHNFDHLI